MRHTHCRSGRNTLICSHLKIKHGRPEHDGHAHRARLNQILSAGTAQGATHHNGAGGTIVRKHFAHAVADNDFGIGGDVGVGSARNAKAEFARRRDGGSPALRMTRYDDGNRLVS